MNSKSNNLLVVVVLSIAVIICSLMVITTIETTLNNGEVYADTPVPTWSGQGSGSETNPYLITDADELGLFRDIVNATGTEQHAVLGKDITLSGDWDPIGSDDKPFKGTFDGNCHTVSGIKFNEPSTGHVGFFANVTYCNSGTEIKNLTVEGDGIVSSSDTGGIVGWLEGRYQSETKIVNCHNYLPITSGSQVGGIVGNATSGLLKISDCSNHATITVTGNGYNVGGIVGSATGPSTWDYNDNQHVLKVEIENCYNDGAITATSSSTNIGGIIGKTAGVVNVRKCFNYNSVTGSTDTFAVIAELGSSSSISGCCYLTIAGSATDERADGHDAAWFADKTSFTVNEDYLKIWDFTNTWEMKENAKYPTFLPEIDLYVAGHIVAVGSTSVTRTNRGYQYDRQYNTLILSNSEGYDNVYFEIEAPSWDAGIHSELADLTIRMCWKSSIDNKNSGDELTRYGIYSTGNLKFTTGGDWDDNGLKIQATSGKSKNAYGIYSEGNITLERGYLDVTAGDINQDGKTIGIYAKSMTVLGKKIVANSYYKSDYSTQIGIENVGIKTDEGITIKQGINAFIAYGRTNAVVGKLVTECSGVGYIGIPYVLTTDSSYYDARIRASIVEYPTYLWNDYTGDYAIAKGTYEHMEDIKCDPDNSTRICNTVYIAKTPIHINAYLEYEMHYKDPVPAPEDYKHKVLYSSKYLTEGSLYDLVESRVTVTSYYEVGGFGVYSFRNSNEARNEDFTVGDYDYTIVMHGSFEIEKAIPDYIAPSPKKLLYTGAEQELIVPGDFPENPNVHSTIEYKVDNGSYSTAIPMKKDTYTYTVTYRVTPDDTDHYATIQNYFYVRIDKYDKTALEEALNTARYNRNLLYNGGLNTTDLDDAISSASNIFETGSATEEQINNAISNLNEVTNNSTVGLYKTLIGEITLPITDLSKESDIKTLKALYDVMTDEQKAQLTQEEKDKLEPAVLQLAAELIKDIGDPKQVTSPESTGKIDNAKGFYDSLTDAQKAQISNAKNLEDAEDYLAADDFKDKMDAIGDPKQVTSPESKTAIQDAKDALSELTDAQKALIDPNLIKDLSDAEDYLAADKAKDLINEIGTVEYPASSAAINAARDAYEALTDAQKALVDNYGDLEDAEDVYGDYAASDVADKINAIGDPKQVTSPESKDAIDAANNAYNQLPATQIGKIPADIRKNLEDANDYYAADRVKDLINAIGTVEYPTSKAAIDAAKGAYDQLTSTQQGLIPEVDRQALENAIDKYATDEAKEKIAQIGDPADVKHTDVYKEKIDAAKEVVDKLTPSQRSLIPSELADYEESVNRYKAEGAKDLISAIGDPADVKHTDAYKEKIDAARDVYDTLTDAQKALVDNIGNLEDAEDQYEVQGVMDLINDIDNVSLETEDKGKIEKAKEAYNKLTPEQKALIPDNVKDDFENIVDEFHGLIRDDITSKVNDIGTVSYDEASKTKIDNAMAAYNNLIEEEKALIPQKVKDKLEDAFNTYDQMDVDATRSVVTDDESGVTIETEGRGVPRNVNLIVEVKTDVTPSNVSPEALEKLIKKTQKIVKIYDVKLIQTVNGVDTEIQPSDIKEGMKIKIHMAIPEGVETKGLSVLHIHGDGSIDVIDDVTIDGNNVIVEVASLSEFAIVEKTSHGFCVGWIVFIFMILELLFACLYIILRYGFLKELVTKCKLDCLYEKMELLTFIGMCLSQVLFIFALIAICLHQCAVTIISFIFVLLIMGAFDYFFLKDNDIFTRMFIDTPMLPETENKDILRKDKSR